MLSPRRSPDGARGGQRSSGRFLDGPYASVQLLLAAGGGLLFLGLLMAASTTISASMQTPGASMWAQLIHELIFIGLSAPVFWLAVRVLPNVYRRLVYPLLGLSLMLLVGVLVPGVGATINGAHRWIGLGSLSLQPSEFAKLAMLLWSADLLARKEKLGTLTTLRHVLVPLVPAFVAVIGLVMLEPDLGTTLCFVLILLGLLWSVGLPGRYFTGMLAAVVAAVTLLAVISPYRLQRLTTFLHPYADQQGSGYQTVQAFNALHHGGLFGVGLGASTYKYGWVPNANSDYVFAIVGEELGLLGCLVVLMLFALFVYAAMRIALRSRDPFIRLTAAGSGIWLGGQALINMGYVSGLLPVTGIPLPFISNGGTSLILTCGVLGMLVCFARHEPAAWAAAQAAAAAGTTPAWVRLLGLRPATVAAVRAAPPSQPVAVPHIAPARPGPGRTPAAGPGLTLGGDEDIRAAG